MSVSMRALSGMRRALPLARPSLPLVRPSLPLVRPSLPLARRSLCSSPKGVNFKDGMEYSQRMDKTGRPISPHLTIYWFPTIAMSSVTVRITGAMASFGFAGVGGLTLVGGTDWALDTVAAAAALSPTLAKFSVAYVLSYQWFGSARHLYWDLTAKGFNNQVMYQGSLVMFAVTAGLSAGLALYSLPPPPKKPDA